MRLGFATYEALNGVGIRELADVSAESMIKDVVNCGVQI
jgi:hypothetical protein